MKTHVISHVSFEGLCLKTVMQESLKILLEITVVSGAKVHVQQSCKPQSYVETQCLDN